MPTLIEQLHDIEGIDAISPWPLAIGWWMCIGLGVLILFLIQRRLKYLRSWKSDALKELAHLEKNLSLSTSRNTLVFLSEYLRRIALRRFPRQICAGLVGDAWLKWLKEHDSKQFDWTEKGKVLIEIPYAPKAKELPLDQIKELIQAVRSWVY